MLLAAWSPALGFAVENIRLSDEIVALGNDIGFDNFGRSTLVDSFTVADVALSDDGSRVVYVADDDFENVQELFSVPVAGGAPVKLHAPLAPPADTEKDVVAFAIAPGKDLVVYLLGQENQAAAELWVAPIDGTGNPYRLRPEADYPAAGVARFLLTPDGSQVVFNAFSEEHNAYALYSVPVDASSDPVELGDGPVQGPVGSQATVDLWEVSADGEHLAYVSKRPSPTHVGVYSAEIGRSGTEMLLNQAPLFNGSVLGPDAMTIVSGHVLYLANEYSSSEDLISVPIRNWAQNQQISRNHSPTVNSLVKSAGGGHVAYRVGAQEMWMVPADGATNAERRLQSSSIGQFGFSRDGQQFLYIDGTDLFSWPVGGSRSRLFRSPRALISFRLDPDGERVTFLADVDVSSVAELYTVPLADGPALKIHRPRTEPNRDFEVDDYQISRLGSRVVFHGDAGAAPRDGIRLFSAAAEPPGGGGVETELSGEFVEGGNVKAGEGLTLVTPDDSRVIFVADKRRDEVLELFSVPIDGGDVVRLNRGNAPVGDVTEIFPSLDPNWIVYRADQDFDDRFDLYAVDRQRATNPVRINEIEARDSKVDTEQVAFSADGLQVFFLGASTGSAFLKLFVFDLTAGELTQLSPDDDQLEHVSDIRRFRLHPDGESVLYLADHRNANTPELFRVWLDAPEMATPVAAEELADTAEVRDDFEVNSLGLDGQAIFTGDLEANNLYDLFSLDLQSGEVTNLSQVPDTSHDLEPGDFRLALGGSAVVFRANRLDSAKDELFFVSLGSPPDPEKISGDLVARGDVEIDFAVVGEAGARVLFRAASDRTSVSELFSCDLEPSPQPPVKLHAALDSGGDVLSFTSSADGSRVAYRAQIALGDRAKLYLASAGEEGSGSLVSPAAEHPAEDIGEDFAFSQDGEWIVFRSDAREDDVPDLYRLRVSDQERFLIDQVGLADEFGLFAISPDSYRVAYRKPVGGIDRVGVFSAPLDGSESPTRMDLGAQDYTDVSSGVAAGAGLAFLSNSCQLLFTDDRRSDTTKELFTAFGLPTITPIADQFVPVDSVVGPVRFTVRDLETRPDGIEVTATSSDQALIPDTSIVILGEGAERELQITPTAGSTGGPVTITLKVRAKGDQVIATFDVTVGDEFCAWLEQYFDPGELADPMLGDPDWDRISNLVEWAMGLDPRRAEVRSEMLSVQRRDDVVALKFRRAKPMPVGLQTWFEWSPDLGSHDWTQVDPLGPLLVTDDLGDAELVEVQFDARLSASGRGFLRIVFERPLADK